MHSPQLSGRSLVRWGIIGCGDVTEVKSGPGFQQASGSQLVAVMRRDGAKAADYAQRHGVPRWYDNATKLINDPEVDAVYVATPPDSHCDYTLAVAAAGKPAYVEKPMARHTPECDRMIAACAKAGQKLFVAYYRRRLPRCLKAGELIRNGVLGRITGVDYRLGLPLHRDGAVWRVDAASAGGGYFLDRTSHVLDLIDCLLGPLTDVTGVAANVASDYAVEDKVVMNFRAGGVPGSMANDFAVAVSEDVLQITGTAGEVRFSVFGTEPVRCETAAGVESFDIPNPPHIAQPFIQSMVDDLLGRGTCPCTGETARRTSQVMDTALTDYYGGRLDQFWLRPATWPGRRK